MSTVFEPGREPSRAEQHRLRLLFALKMTGLGLLLAGALAIASILGFEGRRQSGRASSDRGCMNNLRQIGVALRLYSDSHGGHYPLHDGTDFLVALYASGVLSESSLFLCPATEDDNLEGSLLRLGNTPPLACSFAGRRNSPGPDHLGRFPWAQDHSKIVLASDDDEGAPRYNHGDRVFVLFADGHCEEHPLGTTALGAFGGGGLLDPLGN